MIDDQGRSIVILSTVIAVIAIGSVLVGAAVRHQERKANCAKAGGEYVRKLDICVREDGTVIVGFDR